MAVIHIQYCQSRVGELILGAFNGRLCLLDFRYRKMRERVDKRIKRGLNADYVEHADPVLDLTRRQLDEYFIGDRRAFDLPLLMVGSDFQKRVWGALMQIPTGQRPAIWNCPGASMLKSNPCRCGSQRCKLYEYGYPLSQSYRS